VSFAAVVIIAVYVWPAERLLEGVSVKLVLDALCVTVPTTPGVSVKSVGVIVVGFIGSLKLTVTAALGHAPTLLSAGTIAVTTGAGAQEFEAVVKLDTYAAFNGLPYTSSAPVEIVIVYVTAGLSSAVGVKVAV